METRARTLIDHGDRLFSRRSNLLNLWQEQADHFYVERADFTVQRSLGDDLASHLETSYPLLARRELANSIGAMLRPTSKAWFHMRASREARENEAGRGWLQAATEAMRRAMYDRRAQLSRATKEADNDFATFGNACISVEQNERTNTLLFRSWHLRDVAWCEGADGMVDTLHRRWKPTAREAVALFRHAAGHKLREMAEKQPHEAVELRHVVLPMADYDVMRGEDGKRIRLPFVSVYINMLDQEILEEEGSPDLRYVLPRWQTVSGSQYAYSPATVAALPDARLIQAMTRVLIEAGEKAVDPPLVATHEVVRSEVGTMAGSITWVDAEYDERLGQALRPLIENPQGLPLGMDMRAEVKQMIAQAFFLNQLSPLPTTGNPDMTAFEVGQRVQDYIRQAMPLFEPLEAEYNGALCDMVFERMMRAGAFGSPLDIPEELQGDDITFRFESPLHDAVERTKSQTFLETKALLASAVEIDPSVAAMIDPRAALRDALRGIGTPASWMRDEQQMAEIDLANAERQQADAMLGTMERGAAVAETLGRAGQALAAA